LITPLVLEFATAVLIANAVLERPTIVRPLLWLYSLAAAATALLAVVNLAGSGGLTGGGERVVGLAHQDPAHFAAILVPALIFGFYELVDGRWLIPSAAVVFLSAFGIVLSGTRSAWFAVVIVFALFVIPRLEWRRRFVAITVIAAVAIVVSQIPGVADLIGQRTDTALSTGGAGRTDIWTIGLAIFASSPWIGVGLANFAVANTPEAARQALLPIASGGGLENFDPHNIYVGTLGELGVIGIILLLAFLLPLAFRRGWGPEGLVVQAALGSLLFIGVFLDILNRKELWFFVGLACGLTYLARQVRPPEEARFREAASTAGP
jgi:O-antigen ligase